LTVGGWLFTIGGWLLTVGGWLFTVGGWLFTVGGWMLIVGEFTGGLLTILGPLSRSSSVPEIEFCGSCEGLELEIRGPSWDNVGSVVVGWKDVSVVDSVLTTVMGCAVVVGGWIVVVIGSDNIKGVVVVVATSIVVGIVVSVGDGIVDVGTSDDVVGTSDVVSGIIVVSGRIVVVCGFVVGLDDSVVGIGIGSTAVSNTSSSSFSI